MPPNFLSQGLSLGKDIHVVKTRKQHVTCEGSYVNEYCLVSGVPKA